MNDLSVGVGACNLQYFTLSQIAGGTTFMAAEVNVTDLHIFFIFVISEWWMDVRGIACC